MVEVSIIVPVYNVEQYLYKCFNSIRNQTLSNFEVLLIDDGSIDYGGSICDEYALLDSRFRVYHKANGGVSSARNLGLKNAKGKWVLFLDADDYLHPNCLKICVDNANNNQVDILQFGMTLVNDKNDVISHISENIPPTSINKYCKRISRAIGAGGVMIRNSIIKANEIQFIEDLKIGEDLIFVINCMAYSTKIQHISDELYYYLERSSGSSMLLKNVEQIKKQIQYSLIFREQNKFAKHIIDNQIIARICDLIQISTEYDDYLREVFDKGISISNQLTLKRFLFICCARINFKLACYISRMLVV